MKKLQILFGLVVFSGIIIINSIKVFTGENDLNLASLISIAQAEGEDPPPQQYKKCQEDNCSIEVGVPPFVVTYYGHYWHCVSGEATDYCATWQCWVACDAGP